jgi:repressor LexA
MTQNTQQQGLPPLTERQKQVFCFIQDRIVDWGYPPTIREIGEHMGIRSTNGVVDHLRVLKRKGYLTQRGMKSRTLIPTPEALAAVEGVAVASQPAVLNVPLLGKVAAGTPILAVENTDTKVGVDPSLLGSSQEVFALTVVGQSMIDAGVLPGDIVFVSKSKPVETGAMVVAMIDGEATVKYFYHEGDQVRLQPANASMSPMVVKADAFKDVQVLGVVVGMHRKMH